MTEHSGQLQNGVVRMLMDTHGYMETLRTRSTVGGGGGVARLIVGSTNRGVLTESPSYV